MASITSSPFLLLARRRNIASSVSTGMTVRYQSSCMRRTLPTASGLFSCNRNSCASPFFVSAAATTSTTTRSFLQQRPFLVQQRRAYIYFPTSWQEFKVWTRSAAKKRTIQVKLLKDRIKTSYQSAKVKYGDKYQTTKSKYKDKLEITKTKYQTTKLKYNEKFQTTKKRYKSKYQETKLKYNDEYFEADSIKNGGGVAAGGGTTKNLKGSRRPVALAALQAMKQRLIMRVKKVELTEHIEDDWFDPVTGRPLVSKDSSGRYVNPWMSETTGGVQSLKNLAKWRIQRLEREWNELGWKWFVPSFLLVRMTNQQFETTKGRIKGPHSSAFLSTKALAHDHGHDVDETSDIVSLQSSSNWQQSPISPDMPPLLDNDTIRMTWLGHATCLVQQGSIRILTDPMFSLRASPLFPNAISTPVPVGIKRKVPAACKIEDLPPLDVCMISHDHYDHLDETSVSRLNELNKVRGFWMVPLGLKKWMVERCNVDPEKIVEMEWWESIRLESLSSKQQPTWRVVERHTLATAPDHHPAFDAYPSTQSASLQLSNSEPQSLWVTCCPVQHWCSRTIFDRNKRLWCSFFVLFPNQLSYYFGGDTALPPHFPLFEQISDYLVGGPAHVAAAAAAAAVAAEDGATSLSSSTEPHSPLQPPLELEDPGHIDLAALPIGAYEPEFMMKDAHANPTEAVAIHTKLRARKSIGIHWGTFPLSEEPLEEPPILLEKAANESDADFTTIPHGTFVEVKRETGESYENEDSVKESTF